MPVYKGLNLILLPQDHEYAGHIAGARQHKLTLQKCSNCGLLRYPPGTGCPWCSSMDYTWEPVSGKGTIYSYEIVTQAINPGFTEWVPYPVVLVELDEQRGKPTEDEGLRVLTNLLKEDGTPEDEANVAIGKRVEVTFTDVDDTFSIPQFKLSSEPPQGRVWQYTH